MIPLKLKDEGGVKNTVGELDAALLEKQLDLQCPFSTLIQFWGFILRRGKTEGPCFSQWGGLVKLSSSP